MSYLLDTNICSEHLKRPSGLIHRFVQYSGRLYLPTIVLGELYAWARLRPDPIGFIARIDADLLPDLNLLDFDRPSAEAFGRVHASLVRSGVGVSPTDLMIGCVALAHNLTLVTHNTKDFERIPGLSVEDWLAP